MVFKKEIMKEGKEGKMMETFTTENHNQNLEFANSVREDRLQESLMKFYSTISATREIPWDLMDI